MAKKRAEKKPVELRPINGDGDEMVCLALMPERKIRVEVLLKDTGDGMFCDLAIIDAHRLLGQLEGLLATPEEVADA